MLQTDGAAGDLVDGQLRPLQAVRVNAAEALRCRLQNGEGRSGLALKTRALALWCVARAGGRARPFAHQKGVCAKPPQNMC